MAFNQDTSTSIVSQFKGSSQLQDSYDLDASHGLYSQNVDFILGQNESIQVGTRRGVSQVAQLPSGDGQIPSMDSWYFVQNGIEDCFCVYYSPAQGVKAYNQLSAAFQGVLVSQTGATTASFAFDGLRMYVAFAAAGGRLGYAGGQVYGFPIGADPLFPSPLTTSIVNPVVTQPGPGVVTAGLHRLGFIFTSRNGFVSALNPVNISGIFTPVEFTAPDGTHNVLVTFNWSSIPSYLTPGGTLQVAMTTAANPAQYFLVPNATVAVPPSPFFTTIQFSITDNDLATGTEVTLNQTFLTSINGIPPFKPSALFLYSSRMGYCTLDASGFPVVYFSDQNSYQSLTAAFHGVYLEGRQMPIQGASLGGTCYIGTISGLYATQDNGGLPSTWNPPARVDGSVGIFASSCIVATGGKILLASEKGFYLFRGGAFPQTPISYWQSPDWNRINWAFPYQIQIVDDAYDRVYRVLAPLKVVITNVSNTNPITVTTAVLVNGVPVAYPHLLQTGLSVTISGVSGTTSANTTANITVTGANTFTIPVAGNGAYVPGTNGYSGTVAPNSPNAIMCWAYPNGDDPDELLYSIHAFDSYRAGAMATVRNLSTAIDETWFAPAQSNPGGIIRRVLPTDTPLHRDVDMSGAAASISDIYETSLLPGAQDEAITLHDSHGAHFRVLGNGSLNLTIYGVDHVRSVIPLASPLTLTNKPGLEILVKWFLRSEQVSISFGTTGLDSYFVMALIRHYYTNSLPQR